MDGVPILNIIRKDVAPHIAKAFYAEGDKYDQTMAEELLKNAFDNPSVHLSRTIDALKEAKLKMAVHDITAMTKGINTNLDHFLLGSDPVIQERQNIPPLVYAKLARHEYQLILAGILWNFIPKDIHLNIIAGGITTPSMTLN